MGETRSEVLRCAIDAAYGYWRDHRMVVRWAAAYLLDMEKRFKRIMGCEQLWTLDAKLKNLREADAVDEDAKVA